MEHLLSRALCTAGFIRTARGAGGGGGAVFSLMKEEPGFRGMMDLLGALWKLLGF